MTSVDFQQYIRIFLYSTFSILASLGVSTPENTKTLVFAIVGYAATFAWTLWGTRLNGLLEQIKAKTGVHGVEIKVDPTVIPPAEINQNTSPGIVAKAA